MKKYFFMIFCIGISLFYLYQNLHPKIKYIYYNKGKQAHITVIRASNGDKQYLYPYYSNSITYYFPFDWSSDLDGIILISKHSTDIFLKEDINFCTMEVFLDENQEIKDVKKI